MNVSLFNQKIIEGNFNHPELWPKRSELKKSSIKLDFDFGLDELPTEPGLITLRGPRQYGKSTWMELKLYESLEKFGAGSAFYLNGDEIADAAALKDQLETLSQAYSKKALVRRLFIDEITAIPDWEKALKRALDQGLLKNVLVVTTGSKALDLRRGSERLPGRKGKLLRSEFIFLPISYKEFHSKAHEKLQTKTWMAYLLSGGSPLALNDLYEEGRLHEYFIQLIRDWIFGEIIRSGRNRSSLLNLFSVLFQKACTPVGYAGLARDAGLANNTIASGYIEQLSDLFCLLPSWPWDVNKKMLILRRPCKFHFINLAAAVCLHPSNIRSVSQFEKLEPHIQAQFLEWLVAQEIWRRSVLANVANPEAIGFWQSSEHEIDFVSPQQEWIEVKRGKANALEFGWFPKTFPKQKLKVINSYSFETDFIEGISIEEFLLGK
ncbi:MAG: ATP-binding protein [Deltaproteobacteria bacterium]|nr:ATP-binding protein [Deltaproteobacteria bacterium]